MYGYPGYGGYGVNRRGRMYPGYDSPFVPNPIGIDVTDGDLVMNIPGTDIGIDMDTGQPELNLGGFDIPF